MLRGPGSHSQERLGDAPGRAGCQVSRHSGHGHEFPSSVVIHVRPPQPSSSGPQGMWFGEARVLVVAHSPAKDGSPFGE